MKDFKQQFEIIYEKFYELAKATGQPSSKLALSRFLGVQQGTMQNWEKGATPTAKGLQSIHEKLGFSYTWLITGEGDQFDGSAPPAPGIVRDLQAQLDAAQARVAALEGELAEADRVNRKLTARLLVGDAVQGVGADGGAASAV